MARTKKNLSAKTIKLIRKMIALVELNYKVYDQDDWPGIGTAEEFDTKQPNTCKTTFCGAGFAVLAKGGNAAFKAAARNTGPWEKESWPAVAREALGLAINSGVSYERSSDTLFGPASDWPEPFDRQYYKARGPKGRFTVFSKRWEFFIATDGTDDRAVIVKA